MAELDILDNTIKGPDDVEDKLLTEPEGDSFQGMEVIYERISAMVTYSGGIL